jgi:hypothetical protein
MLPMLVKVHYNHLFYLIKESDDDGDDGVESSMNHTQRNS